MQNSLLPVSCRAVPPTPRPPLGSQLQAYALIKILFPAKTASPFQGNLSEYNFLPPFLNSIQLCSVHHTIRCRGKALLLLSSCSTSQVDVPSLHVRLVRNGSVRELPRCLGTPLLWRGNWPLSNESSLLLAQATAAWGHGGVGCAAFFARAPCMETHSAFTPTRGYLLSGHLPLAH